MSEEEFLKRSYKSFMELEYYSERVKNIDGQYGAIVPVLLLAVDFDERLFNVQPIPGGYYTEEPFWVRCEHCSIPKKITKLKSIK